MNYYTLVCLLFVFYQFTGVELSAIKDTLPGMIKYIRSFERLSFLGCIGTTWRVVKINRFLDPALRDSDSVRSEVVPLSLNL